MTSKRYNVETVQKINKKLNT